MKSQIETSDTHPSVGKLTEVALGYVGEGSKPLGPMQDEVVVAGRRPGRSSGRSRSVNHRSRRRGRLWTAGARSRAGGAAASRRADAAAPHPGGQVVGVEARSPPHGLPLGGRVRLQRRPVGGRPPAESPAVQAAVLAAAGAERGECTVAQARDGDGWAAASGFETPLTEAPLRAVPLGREAVPQHEDGVDLQVPGPEDAAKEIRTHGDGTRTSLVTGKPLGRPHHGRRATIELTDDGRPTERLHMRHAGKATSATIVMKQKPPIHAPPGYVFRGDGSLHHVGLHSSKNFISTGVYNNTPEFGEQLHEVVRDELHMRRPHGRKTGERSLDQESQVGEVVFGRHATGASTFLARDFRKADVDGTGSIDIEEFKSLMRRVEVGADKTDAELRRRFDLIDADGSGTVDRAEFQKAIGMVVDEDRGVNAAGGGAAAVPRRRQGQLGHARL